MRSLWTLILTFLLHVTITVSTSVSLIPGRNAGRVSIYHGGWGTICDDMFGVEEARVICRMLGYKLVVAEAFSSAHFGQGSGTILMDSLRCTGNETDIADCQFDGWGKNDCSHSEDAGVQCSELHLRLVGSTVRYEGRLEGQNSAGVWGEVINTGVTDMDALGVCRILGFDLPSAKVVSGLKFTQGVHNQVQANLTCMINNVCSSDPFSTAHGTPLGIECGHTSVRLVDGKMPLEGRVEVLHNGVWGTLCAEHFTPQDAKSVCSSLGVDMSHQNATVHSNGEFGNGHGPSWLSNIQCTGSEKDIGACRNITWAHHTCTTGSVAALSCPYTNIRLTGGVGPWEGRLEVFHSGSWGTVCGQGFEQPEADVVCKMLGYDSSDAAAEILPNSYFRGLPSRNILLDQLGCFGSEGDITFCRTQDWGVTNCSHTQEVGVRCQTKDVRLVDGSHPLEGRVEVRVNGSWSTICDDHWDDLDATTVCRTLLQYPIDGDVVGKAYQGGVFGRGTGQVGLSYVQCNGTEEDIFHCQRDGQRRVNCDHDRDAGVACYVGYNTTLLDSSNLTNDKEGNIHISGNAICDENWDENDARSVCRSLGYWSSSPTVYENNWFGSSSGGGSNIAPQCRGNEANLAFCPLAKEWGKDTCSTSDIAGVRCNPSPLGYHRVRLVGGDQPGRGHLLVRYNNNWGYVCDRGWTQRDTVVVCRMLRYRSNNMTSTALTKGTSPILVGDIECHGNETDIGLCKADLDKSNCTDMVVGLDCTDNVQAHLVNGTTPLDGRLEVLKDGQWAMVCSSAVSTATAKVVCSMLGYSNTKPILKTFTDASSHVTINEMACEGWEDHIGQCNHPSGLGSVCARNDTFVSLRCFNCSSSYSTETGDIQSINYPQNYENDSDCLYVITPPKSHSPYALVIQDLVMHDDEDFLDIRETPNGPSLGTFSRGDVFPVITGKQFYVRFHSNGSGSAKGFRLTWKPLVLEDAMTLNCGSTTWNAVVNMTVLKSLYPDVGVSDLYLSKQSCTGTVVDDLVVFQQAYTDCSSSKTTTDSDIIYHNQMIYPNARTPFPVIVHSYLWRVDVACNVKRQTNVSQSYVPTAPSATQTVDTGHHHLSGSSNYDIHLTFYQDPGFYQEIKGSPITTHIGDNVYVKVDVNTNDPEVKMRLDTCVAKPTADAGPDLTYPLIQNGCVVDQDTTILSQGSHVTKFLFNAFEFPANHNSVVVSCNATFCRADELSSRCLQTCHARRSNDVNMITRTNLHKPIAIYISPINDTKSKSPIIKSV
ncbi:deleted in malignant brain tumors 1 protein-like [Mizuhopecten yessoensis]|uniref:deleted in malignant brain tumors 1 protein-like n=1 Tax=Mizuhopecten yessoensis TaxID=6573 RepID=UPI000B457CE2|nr:deleted in malignant brain tumors 1 protein-like [Mizuhopecten yessoensis]